MWLFLHFIIFLTLKSCAHSIITTCDLNNVTFDFIKYWPCEWTQGVIPFVYDFYSNNPRRMMALVQKGHRYIEERSCLTFEEHDPLEAARKNNFTYLFYTYSGVLENCCLPYFNKPTGRRLVLLTPTCTLPWNTAHVILHGLGLKHYEDLGFLEYQVTTLFFYPQCSDVAEKLKLFGNSRLLKK